LRFAQRGSGYFVSVSEEHRAFVFRIENRPQ